MRESFIYLDNNNNRKEKIQKRKILLDVNVCVSTVAQFSLDIFDTPFSPTKYRFHNIVDDTGTLFRCRWTGRNFGWCLSILVGDMC